MTGDPSTSSRSLTGSTVIITGASSGIGRSAATMLASLGAGLILVGRSPEKHRAVQADLDDQGAAYRLVAADFGRLSSVVAAASLIAEGAGSEGELLLINNAATAGRRGVTDDGFELAFGVNYFAHFLLTFLLLGAKLSGVGLGLAIARDIAQTHGGSLTLRNRSPHGLEAILRLPRTAAR